MKKRILVLLSVVALMVVMMAVSVAPAFAAMPLFNCSGYGYNYPVYAKNIHYFKAAGYDCVRY